MIKKSSSLEVKLIVIATLVITSCFLSNFYYSNLETNSQLQNISIETTSTTKYEEGYNSKNFSDKINQLLSLSKGTNSPFQPLVNTNKLLSEAGGLPMQGMPGTEFSLEGLDRIQNILGNTNVTNEEDTTIQLEGIIGSGKNVQAIIHLDNESDFYKVGDTIGGNTIMTIGENYIKVKDATGQLKKIEFSTRKKSLAPVNDLNNQKRREWQQRQLEFAQKRREEIIQKQGSDDQQYFNTNIGQ